MELVNRVDFFIAYATLYNNDKVTQLQHEMAANIVGRNIRPKKESETNFKLEPSEVMAFGLGGNVMVKKSDTF